MAEICFLLAKHNETAEKDDDRAILTAAAKAEEAASLLLNLGGRVTPEQFDDASDDAALAA